MKTKNINSDDVVMKAMEVLTNVERSLKCLKIKLESSKYVHVPVINVWRPAHKSIATEGVLSSSIDSKDYIKELIYMPIGSKTMPHIHKGVMQKIVVISGIIEYTLYEDETTNKIKKKGILKEFEDVTFSGDEMHYVFTTLTNAYILSIYAINIKS